MIKKNPNNEKGTLNWKSASSFPAEMFGGRK